MQAERNAGRANLIAVLLVAVAIVLGGGGSPSPLPEMALQLLVLLALAAWAFIAATPLPQSGRQAWAIAALILILPLVQLIPLPAALWHNLPGRETERAALALVGAENGWRPWSVAPARTLASLLALLAPAVILLMVASLQTSGRTMVIATVAGMSLFSLLLGTAQMAGGEANTLRFYVPDMNYLGGFQANHNSTADVLLIGMIAFAAAAREWRPRGAAKAANHGRSASQGFRLGIVAGTTLLFSLGVFLTASRAGVFLLPLAWLAVLVIVRPWLHFSRRAWLILGAAAAGALVIAALVLVTSGVVARVTSRYSFGEEFRPKLWRDTLYAIGQYFPWGSGIGTFVPVFIAIERLEVVDPSVPNRAHNDFLELALEGGVFGIAILAAIALMLTRRIYSALRSGTAGSSPQAQAATAILAVLAAHSQVDYPLRSMSLACIAAVAAGLLMPANRKAFPDSPVQ